MNNDINSSGEDVCQVQCIHHDSVDLVKESMIDEEVASDLAAIFKVLGDPTRVKILHALSINELCVCDIAAVVSMNHSTVSHQMRVLRTLRLVKARREGKMVYYCLDDDHIKKLFDQGLEHVKHR